MAKRQLPPQGVLRQLLSYDPETGKLFWKERGLEWFKETKGRTAEHACANWNSRYAGKEAFTWTISGYRFGCIGKEKYAAHRVIWKMEHGVEPDEIDHIDGNRSHNRLINLRDVPRAVNAKNVGRGSSNTSGYVGVFWNTQASAWHARIKVKGKIHHIGTFHNIEEAISARKLAEQSFGFHQNHGR